MISKCSILIFIFAVLSVATPQKETMTDSRDGKKYKTVKIGNQVWMAENINFETEGSFCYDNDSTNCDKFGRLYTRDAAQNACPKGWILPKQYDLTRLADFAGIYSGRIPNATKRLMVKEFCDENGCGSDEFGFSAIPTGSYIRGKFVADTSDENSLYGNFKCWLDGLTDETRASMWRVTSLNAGPDITEKNNGFPVRCLKSASLKDRRDGKKYKAMKINGQIWLTENLNYKTPRSRCHDESGVDCYELGRYYYWNEAVKACPDGWRLPSSNEWEDLYNAMGKDPHAMQAVGFTLKSTDAYNFSVIPAGFYDDTEKKFLGSRNNITLLWTSTESSNGTVFVWGVGPEKAGLQGGMPKSKEIAASVRCIKDNAQSNNTNVESVKGSFTDSRDGQTYKTVQINDQTWMAENLKYGKGVCLNGKKSNCKKYGMLYGEKDTKKVCPNGWHLPSAAEFKKLLNYVGRDAAKKLKAKKGWDKNGTDQFGFAALPGGAVGSGDGEPGNWFLGGATFFTSTIDEDNNYGPQPFVLHFNEFNSDEVSIESMNGNIWGHSVRCIKD